MSYLHTAISSQRTRMNIVNIHNLMVRNRIIEDTSVSSLECENESVKHRGWEKPLDKSLLPLGGQFP